MRETYLGKAPLARSATAMGATQLGWKFLSRVLVAAPPPDAIVVGSGLRVDLPIPTTLEALLALFGEGLGLALRHTQRCSSELTAIHAEFEREIGPAEVQIFVTPARTHGFGWHYDDEDVFIAQTAGIKEYYFRPNTITTRRAHAREFARYREEESPLAAATLTPGDVLYIPARWWHVALCQQHAVSISVGVRRRP